MITLLMKDTADSVTQPVNLVMLVLDPLKENVLFVDLTMIVQMVNTVLQIFPDVSMKKLFVIMNPLS